MTQVDLGLTNVSRFDSLTKNLGHHIKGSLHVCWRSSLCFRALDWCFVLFAWACFVSDVSSCCPFLRGPRHVFFKWSFSFLFFGFRSLVEVSFVRFFSFIFLPVYYKCALIKGEIEDHVWVWGPVDGHFLVWWVIDNVVWTDSWLSIAGASCSLTGVGAGEEQAWKVVVGEASRCGEDK
jgi:hypothetical protein